MRRVARFAYAQARLQARHGQRAGPAVFHRLRSSGDLGEFLHMARQTELRPWVLALHPSQSSHEMEQSLRELYRRYVGDVSRWLPEPWPRVVARLADLVDLPALQHLLSGREARAWMRDDPVLRPLSGESLQSRFDTLQRSHQAYLLRGAELTVPLFDVWYEAWQRQWPGPAHLHGGLAYLARLLRQQVHPSRARPGSGTAGRRAGLDARLCGAFRRYSFQPAAACAHLGLVALDLERLRGDLLIRRLLPAAGSG